MIRVLAVIRDGWKDGWMGWDVLGVFLALPILSTFPKEKETEEGRWDKRVPEQIRLNELLHTATHARCESGSVHSPMSRQPRQPRQNPLALLAGVVVVLRCPPTHSSRLSFGE